MERWMQGMGTSEISVQLAECCSEEPLCPSDTRTNTPQTRGGGRCSAPREIQQCPSSPPVPEQSQGTAWGPSGQGLGCDSQP